MGPDVVVVVVLGTTDDDDDDYDYQVLRKISKMEKPAEQDNPQGIKIKLGKRFHHQEKKLGEKKRKIPFYNNNSLLLTNSKFRCQQKY